MTTQEQVTRDFYIANPHRDIPHAEAVDAIAQTYEKATGKKFRDPDRAIRKLREEYFLIKIGKGVYRYDPEWATKKAQENFTVEQKQDILMRGNYKCAICGNGRQNGVELHVDHIRSKDRGGKATIANGQVLCAAHNFKKKNYNQTETAKQLFINLHSQAKEIGDEHLMKFAKDVLATYEKHDVNGHIVWQKDDS